MISVLKKMKGSFVLTLCAIIMSGSATQLDSAASIEDFFSGFVQGLRLSATAPSVCYNDTLALAQDVQDMVYDIQRLIKGDESALIALLTDY
jgi:hypothetical protein